MTVGGPPRPPYPPQPQYAPPRPKRPTLRLVAAVFWVAAAALAVGATFLDFYEQALAGDTHAQFNSSFWKIRTIYDGNELSSSSVLLGVTVIIAAVVLVVAALFAFVSMRRWLAVVTGALGTGMLLNESLGWVLFAANGEGVTLKLGWWLLVAAAVAALAGFAIALAERTRPVQLRPYAPPPPPPPPRWEPQTPRYGIPVQQPEPPAQQPEPTTHLDQPDRTVSISQPKPTTAPDPDPPTPPEPGTIARKLGGDET
jgi:hypothetical protein